MHRVISENPPNTGVGLESLTGESLDQQQMYVRCNLPVPSSPPSGFELVIPGRSSRFITLDELESLQRVTTEIVLECAGNGRALMDPVPEGVQWGLDGVSPVTISGFRLIDVLGPLPDDVVEVVFTGADVGEVPTGARVHYQFSITRGLAVSTIPVLVTHIGGEALTHVHGAPIRLVVPGDYAMKSVKWLTKVEATTVPFRGYFVDRYRYVDDPIEDDYTQVGRVAVRSVIASPGDGETVTGGIVTVRGSAWSGHGEVSRVEVSLDGGQTWNDTEVVRGKSDGRWAPVRWAYETESKPGILQITARAIDAMGDAQPLEARWNARGYANNVAQKVTVTVIGS